MIASILALFGGSSILAAIAGLGTALPFVGVLMSFFGARKWLLPLIGAGILVAGVAIGAGVIMGKIVAYGNRRHGEGVIEEAARWRERYDSALSDMGERLRQAQVAVTTREQGLLEAEDQLNVDYDGKTIALRGALSGDAGGVVIPESVLGVFRSAARPHAGH